AAERVVAASEFATAKAHIADDDIVGIDFGRFATNANAIARSGLASDSNERVIDWKPICQRNDPGNPKHDNARFGSSESFGQTAGTAVIERGHFINFSAAATGSNCARAFRTGKGGDFWRRPAPDGGGAANEECRMQNEECERKNSKSKIRNSKQI